MVQLYERSDHLDIPPSPNFRNILICIARFTRWPEAILITNMAAKISGWAACLETSDDSGPRTVPFNSF